MAVATRIVLLVLIDLSFQEGTQLLPPQNVTLSSENFYSFLTWNPAPDATRNTQYDVERNNGNRSFPEWIQVASCGENSLERTQSCRLHLSKLPNSLHKFYEARVRAKHGPHSSEWAISNRLQLYRDSVIGPLDLFLAVANWDLTVSVSLPKTPLNDNVTRVIASIMKVGIILKEEGDDNTKEITMEHITMNHTFQSLKPNANYCITATVKDQPAKEAVKCIKMPRKSADDGGTPFVTVPIILLGLFLLCLFGGAFLKHYLHPSSSEMAFPKSLTFVNATASTLKPALEQDDGSATSLSTLVVLPSDSNVMTEQEGSQIQMDAGGYNAWVYCANGLCPGNMDYEDGSQLPAALADSLPSRDLLGNEHQTQWPYRTSQELLESSEHPPPERTGYALYGLKMVSWEPTSKIKNENRQRKRPSLGRTDIPLSSVKLQPELDAQRTYMTVKDGGTYVKPPLPQASESQAHPRQNHSSKDRKLPDRSNLETMDRNVIGFSGYERHPPILPCEF